eukprot:g25704.t1
MSSLNFCTHKQEARSCPAKNLLAAAACFLILGAKINWPSWYVDISSDSRRARSLDGFPASRRSDNSWLQHLRAGKLTSNREKMWYYTLLMKKTSKEAWDGDGVYM